MPVALVPGWGKRVGSVGSETTFISRTDYDENLDGDGVAGHVRVAVPA